MYLSVPLVVVTTGVVVDNSVQEEGEISDIIHLVFSKSTEKSRNSKLATQPV